MGDRHVYRRDNPAIGGAIITGCPPQHRLDKPTRFLASAAGSIARRPEPLPPGVNAALANVKPEHSEG